MVEECNFQAEELELACSGARAVSSVFSAHSSAPWCGSSDRLNHLRMGESSRGTVGASHGKHRSFRYASRQSWTCSYLTVG